MTTDGERLARLEEQLRGVRKDLAEVHAEVERARQRLHNLEGITQMFVDAQKVNRRREEEQYRRLGNLVGLGSLGLSFGLLFLSAVTLFLHHG